MHKPEINILILFFIVVAMALSPFWSLGFFSTFDGITGKEFAGAAAEFLSLANFYDSIKQNFSIPSLGNNSTLAPQQLKENIVHYSSPKIQDINKGVEDETGVNLPKFLRWSARMMGSFFLFFGDILKKIGGN